MKLANKNEGEKSAIKNETVSDMKTDQKKKGLVKYGVLVKPLITEKITNLAKEGKYVFESSRNANKIEIRQAFKNFYGITPTDINIIKMKGKRTGSTRKISGKRKDWKKAIITLTKGETINVYESSKKRD